MRKSEYPRLVDVIGEPYGNQTVGEILAGLLAPLSLTPADLTDHYRRRRINARACTAADRPAALEDWLADVRDTCTEAAQLAGLSSDYAQVVRGGLTDDGRTEVRTLYATPNGMTAPAGKIGEEKTVVSGEYAGALDRAASLEAVKSFKWLLLDKFEFCFLGVM